MILQALKEYYDRKAADPDSDVAPDGWIWQRIDYEIIIDKDGNFIQLNNKRENNLGFPTMVPNIGKQASKHNNSGKDANLLWDKPGFVLGIGKNGKTKLDSFIETIDFWFDNRQDLAVDAVRKFLLAGKTTPTKFSPILNHPDVGQEIQKGRGNITFKLIGDDRFIFEKPSVKDIISTAADTKDRLACSVCLVTGNNSSPIVDCHRVIKGLYGAKKDPNLVSFNEEAFCSFGKLKSYNAPVSKKAVDAYTESLSRLMRSNQKIRLETQQRFSGQKNHHPWKTIHFTFFQTPRKTIRIATQRL